MGCKACIRENTELFTQQGKEVECKGKQSHTEVISTLDYPVARDRRKQIHNLAKKTFECHAKLSMDQGRLPKHSTEGQAKKVANQLAAQKIADSECPPLEKLAIDIVEPEAKRDISVPKIKIIENLSKKAAIIQPSFEGNPIRKYTLLPNISLQTLRSQVSIPFESKNLVMEKKGSIFDSYETISKIGRGAFGEVMKVRCIASGKIYAMKAINRRCFEETEKDLQKRNRNSQKTSIDLIVSYIFTK